MSVAVPPTRTGKTNLLILKLFWERKNPCLNIPNSVLEIIAEKTGDITQDKTIPPTPPTKGNVSFSDHHITQSEPLRARVIPIIPPTHE